MNEFEKQIILEQLESEKDALNKLKKIYEDAKKEIEKNIANLDARTDMQNLQTIIYQKKYQEELLKQVEYVLKNLGENQYATIEEFLEKSYKDGYVGSMWLLEKETGYTVFMPVDDKKVVRALTTDSKLSSKYYKENPLRGRLIAEDIEALKENIRIQTSIGINTGKSWKEVATQIAGTMNTPFERAMNDAMRIARTEGHRINQQGCLDACYEAKKNGAKIVKQWDATLDKKTRPEHAMADGQIVEIDEKFIVGGEELDAPSIGGSAWNVCNCRCQLLQRATWALDENELKELESRAKSFGLDKSSSLKDFKDKYLKLS